MKTKEFLSLLAEYQSLALHFEYMPGAFVGANYHITEVKHLSIDAVDCGGQADAWNETLIQLLESPTPSFKKEYMTAYKALAILKKVGRLKPYDLEAEIKFEYSNSQFHTAQLFVNDSVIQEDKLILRLGVKRTECKASELCGIVEDIKETVEACCSPEGGCC